MTTRLTSALALTLALVATPLLANELDDFVVPEGFEARTLEPTGGRIARPVGWFYREAHDAASFKWVLSKEDPDSGPYQTGVRIQMIFGLKQKAGKSAADFAKDFLDSKRASSKVLSECETEDQGLLIYSCLVTEELIVSVNEEDPFQIRYGVFWGSQLDVAVFVIAGTPQDQWPEHEAIFSEIEKFQLIDLERFAHGD